MEEIRTSLDAQCFIKGSFDKEAIQYLENNTPLSIRGTVDYDHVLQCLKSMIAQLFHLYPAGDFGQAVLRNDLFEAVGRADDKNLLCLDLYVKFLYNKVPWDLVLEARKGK